MKKLTVDELVKCPHCGKDQEEPVQDFVIPGKTGEASIANNDCIWCDKNFFVETVNATEFLVYATS